MNRLAFSVPAPRSAQLALYAVLIAALGAGCGDDDAPAPNDAGDAEVGSRAGTTGTIGPRRDAQVMGQGMLQDCVPTEPLSCPAGQRCHAVVTRASGEPQFTLTTGCIEDRGGRALGAPCDPWSGGLAQYRAEGLEDEVYIDPCDSGLFCAPHPHVRGAFSCQQTCPLGTCASSDEQCVGDNIIEAVCTELDRCDPLTGGGCGAGLTCYLQLDAPGERVLTSCLPTPASPLADGAACRTFADCLPGSSCWGPPRLPPARWVQETLLCRPTCNAMATMPAPDGLDGGDDEDAGARPSGACTAGTSCRELSASGLEVDLLADGFGQCE